MLVNPTFTGFVEFCTSGDKSTPGASLLASGYLPSEILPAEQFNWLLNRASKGVSEAETYLVNINAELNAILVKTGGSYSGGTADISNRIGNSSGYIPLSNGTVCTNLNAEKWGGGTKTVSTSDPTGGVDGDIWIKV